VSLPRFALSLFICMPYAMVALLAPACLAQLPPVSNTTSTPIPGAGHDYLGGPAETVNPANGSVSIRLPVILPISRGITLPFSFAYDTSGVSYVGLLPTTGYGSARWQSPSGAVNPWTQGGWNHSVPTTSVTLLTWKTLVDGGPTKVTCQALVNFVFQDARGNRHNLGLTDFSDFGNNGPCTLNSNDWPKGFQGQSVSQGGEGPILASIPGDGAMVAAPSVVDGDGVSYGFADLQDNGSWIASSVADRNGNTITINSTFPTFNYVDTAGRTVLQDSGFAVSPETLTVSGLAAPYTLTWTTLAQPTFTTAITTLYGTCSSPAHTEGTQKAVSSITLPNGNSFTFTYDPAYARVNKITYPTGGYVRYVWGMNTQAEWTRSTDQHGFDTCNMNYAVPAITDRYVSFDGTHEVLHQQYTYSTTWPTGDSMYWTSKQTTVTTYDLVRNTNSQTVYTYSPVYKGWQPNAHTGAQPEIPVETSIAFYDTTGSLLETVAKGWANERLLASQETTFPNGQASETTWTYNTNEMETEHDDYDFGTTAPPNPPGPLLRATVTSYATSTAMAASHVIDKPATVIVYSDAAKTNRVAETDYTYDSPAGTITSGIVQHSGGCNCGNLTQQSHWVDGSGTNKLTTNFTNDDTGQRLSMTDPRGNQTTYSYTDSYSSGTPPGPTNAYLTTVTHPQTSGVNHIEKFAYAYASGEVTSSTDQNNLVTTYKYVDNLARLTETDSPDGGVTSIAYNDSPYNPSTPSPSVTTTKKINGTTNLVAVSAMDGLGHVLNKLVTSDPQGTIHVDTAYDGLGRFYTVSNPYRSGTDPTTSSGTTTYIFDALGRKCVEIPQDGTAVSANTCPASAPSKDLFTQYSGPTTTVTDQTGKKRQSTTDGLGRLIQVVEDPGGLGYITNYTIDTLGNLTQVVQNGSHTRTFTYDFLSRLLTSNNPEVGTITYKYDSDTSCSGSNSFPGLLVSKTDARGIRSCAQYDALNRETVHNYSNGDATVTTVYDGSSCLGLTACQNIGHATSITDAAGSESWAYQVDPANLRSVHVNQRTTSNIAKTSTYYFDLASNLTSITYPTGRIVYYTYDAANRPASAVDSANGITYAAAQVTPPTGCLTTGVCYTPQGTEYSAAIGKTGTFNGVNLSETYNSRLQPLEIKASSSAGNAFDITYSFVDPASSGNAGHLNSITNNLDTTRSQTFSYDSLNRITGALTTSTYATSPSHCWGEAYTLDAWGNLNSISATTNPNYTGCTEESGFSVTADGNNHLPIFGYDISGNTQSDGYVSYTYDAESQIKTAAGITYLYDGSGRRVSKSSGKLYWYGSGGEILSETDASGNTLNEYIFFGGKRIAMLPAGGNPEYYAEDLLGSSRVTTANNGTVCYDADFYPYGGERAYTNNCPSANVYKFEGKERDTETGNDDFGARSYSSRFGRWLSADWSNVPVPVPYANLTNPQTLNLYAMVSDDHESFADLDGHIQLASQGLSAESGGINPGTGELTGGLSCESHPESCESVVEAQDQQNQIQKENQQPKKKQKQSAPPNSRTDVVLHGRQITPTPQRGTGSLWQMDWYASTCSATDCSAQTAANNQQTITLVESADGGPWQSSGDPIKGEAHDFISPEGPRSFNQRWFVDGKQVQLVVGKDSNGNLIKTWEVHVVVNKMGDRPVYSPVP
jgi:RHS repeat-associated protein